MKEEKFTIRTLTDSKDIGKALANDTARQILEVLSNGPLSISQISQKLKKPLTTIDYALKILLNSKLVKSEKHTWNKKGRITKLYSLQEKYIVITPRKEENVVDTLKKFLPIFVGIVVISIFLELSYIDLTFISPEFASIAEMEKPSVISRISRPTPHYGIIFLVLSLGLLFLYILAKQKIFSLRKIS